MKRRLFHFGKRSIGGICLCLAVMLVFSMILTGCNKKEIQSEAQEEAATKDTITSYTLEVVYTKVDKTKLNVKHINDLYPGNKKAFIADHITSQPVYKTKDRDDVYVAYVDSTAVNGVSAKLIDYTFYSSGKTDGMKYDVKNGVVYIPKSLFDKANDKDYSIGIQLMMAVDPADK